MRIIIELDNVEPVTLKVSPTEGEQSSPKAQAKSSEEAIDAGAAPNGDSSQSSTETAMTNSNDSTSGESAGPAPSI